MRKAYLSVIHTMIIAYFLLLTPFFVHALESQAPYAILMDAKSGAVLFEKNGYKPTPPSSMTKLMTLYIAFNKLKTGVIKEEDLVTVSAAAYQAPGTRMFLEIGQQVKVSDLLLGMIVQSGNDATIALAEYIAGTEANFVTLMNQEAEKLGLKHSYFMNSSGLPHPQQHMSCYDLAALSNAIISEHPQFYSLFSRSEFTYADITQYSRNTALGQMGVDGLKTGFTDSGGYGIAMSAKTEDGRRVIAVVNGLPSEPSRIDAARDLITHATHHYHAVKIIAAEQEVTTIPVWHGKVGYASLVSHSDIEIMLPKSLTKDKLHITVIAQAPLIAPLGHNIQVATMHITAGNSKVVDIPLYPKEDVSKAGWIGKTYQNIMLKIRGI